MDIYRLFGFPKKKIRDGVGALGALYSLAIAWVPYRVYTWPMSEATAQKKLITSLKATGCRVQKFTDQFGFGIPDLLAGTKDLGLWVEMKFMDRWPVKPTTPVLPKDKITGNQVFWLTEWWMRPCPTCVVLAFGDGTWLLMPAPLLSRLTETPSSALTVLRQSAPLSRLSIHHLTAAMADAFNHMEKCDV